MTVLEVIGLEKEYTNRSGGSTVRALRGVNFAVDAGEYVAIMGESGSGKTTLLNILASLDEPTGGRVLLDGKDLADVSERELAAFRRDNLGFVFQDFNLLDTFSVSATDTCRRAYGLARFAFIVGAAACFRRPKRTRADYSDGHALGRCGIARGAHTLYPRRRALSPDIPRRQHERAAVSEDFRHTHHASQRG